ncbi:MAG: acyloxyacyl hydrolase [Bryobacteraceae bacterium]
MTRLPWLLLCLAPPAAYAGLCSDSAAEPRNDFEFLAGYSPGSSTFLIGRAPDRRFAIAGFAYSFRCRLWDSVAIDYTATVLPAAILLQPTQSYYFASGGPLAQFYSPAHAVYGVGVEPLGFTFEFARRHRLEPFVELGGGIIASTQPVPYNIPNGTGLNFLADLGGGVRWKIDRTRAVSIGYRLMHISNANTTGVNPGIDNHVLWMGFSWSR